MKPHFGKVDIKMYYYYLDKSNIYFEFGSGGSTYKSCSKPNIKKIYSVESDLKWYNNVKQNVKSDKLNFILVDLKCQSNNWGRPGSNCTDEDKIRYSNAMLNLTEEERNTIDLVLIDGRFRVACCLKTFLLINNNCNVIFDDFLNRKEYHIVLNYFNIIGYTSDKRMVVLKKKNCDPPNLDIIKKYELIES